MRKYMDRRMGDVEANTRKIVQRLLADGWQPLEGGRHQKFGHPDRPRAFIVLSRQRDQSIGVARATARAAGWI